ncbi:hypothetical protein G7070_15925 [Propioniciclava coleopterorum]|uniref:Glyoxalase-like domain-containing protein n=1 Tax=Propioniciclava coleopterorum TaxID=2714937 RepID=A0A6G7Y9W7_9ACTN|nr:VOC family protein [Propioniciclava coleopterorum]QIK73476.1 hypothetical protein G7070_15925 [Propioniciclava coleopterorum]
MTTPSDWRTLNRLATAWFDTGSLTQSALLAERILALAPDSLIDVRPTGVRVRVADPSLVDAVSGAARDLGLTADPAALQELDVVIEATDRPGVAGFWAAALGRPAGEDELRDPWRRDPALLVAAAEEARPLRSRIHLDVVRPAEVVARAGLGEGSGPYGVRHADPDGNEVDLVPGDPLDAPGTEDWQAVFSAVACYRVETVARQTEVAAASAALAQEVGFPLLIDLRPGWVILDSGKDRWDADAHGLDLEFGELAGRLQSAARAGGAVADPEAARFVQVFLDAADVAAVRAFWVAALGYEHDRREGLTDIVDPRRLNPVFAFQRLDTDDTERRGQRNRVHVVLTVPADTLADRVAAALAAGGSLLSEGEGSAHLADPEGNELVLANGA